MARLGMWLAVVAVLVVTAHGARDFSATSKYGFPAHMGQEPEPIPTPLATYEDYESTNTVLAYGDNIDHEADNFQRKWSWCADNDQDCFCNGAVRYGSYGTDEMYQQGWFSQHPEVKKWTYKRNCGYISCATDSFGEDPFPQADAKICQCAPPRPTPTPEPRHLEWKWCANDGQRCKCDKHSVMRFGSTGPSGFYGKDHADGAKWWLTHPDVKKWKYIEAGDTKRNFKCVNETIDGTHPWPEKARIEMDLTMICQCAPLPPNKAPRCTDTPTPKPVKVAVDAGDPKPTRVPGVKEPWELDWKWCSKEDDDCECSGTVRYGHSGPYEYYEQGSTWFKEHQEVFKWVHREVDGVIKCDSASFGDNDPFPGHAKMCQCAHSVDASTLDPMALDVIVTKEAAAAAAAMGKSEAELAQQAQPQQPELEEALPQPQESVTDMYAQPEETNYQMAPERPVVEIGPGSVQAESTFDQMQQQEYASGAIPLDPINGIVDPSSANAMPEMARPKQAVPQLARPQEAVARPATTGAWSDMVRGTESFPFSSVLTRQGQRLSNLGEAQEGEKKSLFSVPRVLAAALGAVGVAGAMLAVWSRRQSVAAGEPLLSKQQQGYASGSETAASV